MITWLTLAGLSLAFGMPRIGGVLLCIAAAAGWHR